MVRAAATQAGLCPSGESLSLVVTTLPAARRIRLKATGKPIHHGVRARHGTGGNDDR